MYDIKDFPTDIKVKDHKNSKHKDNNNFNDLFSILRGGGGEKKCQY